MLLVSTGHMGSLAEQCLMYYGHHQPKNLITYLHASYLKIFVCMAP
jgi:hypothetical protein